MTTRRERRQQRNQPPQRTDLVTTLKNFATSWGGLISASVGLIAIVLVIGIFRIPLPFINQKPETPPDAWGTVSLVPDGTIKIAYIGDTSSGKSLDASGAPAAIRQVLKERSKVKDASVELVTIEDSCNGDAATAKARELSGDPLLVAVISGACPSSVLAARTVFEETHIAYLVINDTDPEVTPSGTQSTFRTSWNQKAQGSGGAITAFTDLSFRRALVFFDTTKDAETVARDFATNFRLQKQGPIGGQVPDVQQVSTLQADLDRATKSVTTLEPDLIFFAGSGQVASAVLARAKASGYNGPMMVSNSVWQDTAFSSTAPEGTLVLRAELPKGGPYDTWKETYERDNGSIGPISAEAFDAAQLLLQSLNQLATTKDNKLELGRRVVASVLRTFPYEGVTGKLGFDAKGDRVTPMVSVLRYEGGNIQPVAKKALDPSAAAPSADANQVATAVASASQSLATQVASGTPPAGLSTPVAASSPVANTPVAAASPAASPVAPATQRPNP